MASILAEQTTRPEPVTADEPGLDEQSSQIVSFQIGEETYGVGIMDVQEIILIGPITPIPSVPEYILGLTNLRGHVIPVVDLAARFRLNHQRDRKTSRIVVLNVGSRTIGIVVDAVDEVLRIRDSDVEHVTQDFTGPGRGYVGGMVKLEGRLVILLRVDRILDFDQSE